MREFACMIRRYEQNIIGYSKIRIDIGSVEALNNKAKAVVPEDPSFEPYLLSSVGL